VARALRAAVRCEPAGNAATADPAILLVDGDGAVTALTSAAELWLDELNALTLRAPSTDACWIFGVALS
jgi:hypothetical protein